MPGPKDSENIYVQIVYQPSLVENMFTRDSRKFIGIIKEPNLRTDAEKCIRGIQCRRKAILEIQSHCDGTSVGSRRKTVDRVDPKKIFYKNETIFTHENYVTKLKGGFNVLEKYGASLYEEQMVDHILDQLMSLNTELKTEFNIWSSSHLSKNFKSSA